MGERIKCCQRGEGAEVTTSSFVYTSHTLFFLPVLDLDFLFHTVYSESCFSLGPVYLCVCVCVRERERERERERKSERERERLSLGGGACTVLKGGHLRTVQRHSLN